MQHNACCGVSFYFELWGELTLTEGLKRARNDLAKLIPCKFRASLVCTLSISCGDCKRAGNSQHKPRRGHRGGCMQGVHPPTRPKEVLT